MRKTLPLLVLAALATGTTTAQTDRFAYAITDVSPEGSNWIALRRLDLATGRYSAVLLNGTENLAPTFDAASKKPLSLQPDARFGNLVNLPFGTGVAAAAYDRAHHRLWFTPMFVDQLRYIDLRTMKLHFVTGQAFSGAGHLHNDEARIITRMVIAADGYGYAVNNDGSALVRFSTGKKPVIEQLGALVDDPANKGVSVHNRCTSFGGDMIADDEGSLYILSARNQVFKINPTNRVATHVGGINGLPADFTVNGAVVDGEGQLLVSSAVNGAAYFAVNPSGWSAIPYTGAPSVFRSSDLANGNHLAVRKANNPLVQERTRPLSTGASLVSAYPNPVAGNSVTLAFGKLPAGDYTVELTDALARPALRQRVVVQGEGQTQTLRWSAKNARGTYLLRLVDQRAKPVHAQKILLQ